MTQRTVRHAITAVALIAALAGTGAAHAAGPERSGGRTGGLWGWLIDLWEVVGGAGIETVTGRMTEDQEGGSTAGTTGPSPSEGTELERAKVVDKEQGYGMDPDG